MTVLENLQMGAIPSQESYFAEDVERVFGLFPVLRERACAAGRHPFRWGAANAGDWAGADEPSQIIAAG